MKQNLEIVRGTSNTFGLTITDGDGNPYTLSENDTLVFGLKRRERDDQRVLIKPITHSVDDEYFLELSPEDTIDLVPGRYYYDVGLQRGDDVFYNIVEQSEFLIIPNVTKRGDGA